MVQAGRAAHEDGKEGRYKGVAGHARLHEVYLRWDDITARYGLYEPV